MYAKLILKNVWKNIKDYGIYFFTLLIAVAVFYAFNAIEAQPAFQETMASKTNVTEQLIALLRIVSKLIAVLLAFLIVYANQFLLKRRKRELAIYMILGMSGRKISFLFVCETIVIAAAAVAAGIGVGCLFSQGISVFALQMFHYDLSSYKFCFSVAALQQTVICFVLIFALVLIFNMRTILKVKLIDMLHAGTKNEAMKVKQSAAMAVMFLCAIILYTVSAYLIYMKKGLSFKNPQSVFCVVALCMATAMLIYSMSGVVLKLLRRNENWYFKGLNCFFIRQISSKIQTNFVTMTVITLMLTGTMCIVSLGMGMADSMNQSTAMNNTFDLMLQEDKDLDRSVEEFCQDLQKRGFDMNKELKKWAAFSIYDTENITLEDVLANAEETVDYVKERLDETVGILSVSDYNAAMRVQGKPEISLSDNTYRMNSNFKFTDSFIEEKMKENPAFEVAGVTLTPDSQEVLHNNYYLSAVGMNDMGTMIVPDAVADNLKTAIFCLVGVCKPGYDKDVLEDKLSELSPNPEEQVYTTADAINAIYYGSFAMLAFVCCYLGVILLIICVAILALQQLTETTDNVSRYRLLGKLGVEKGDRNKALFKQITVYFGVPLLISIVYTIAALPKIIMKVRDSLAMEVGSQMVFLIAMLVVVYGSYFVITYLSCRRMIQEKERTCE